MTKKDQAKEFLDRLKHERDVWQRKQDAMRGDRININHPIYRMAVSTANKYYTAKRMYELLTGENLDEADQKAERTDRA